MESNESQFNGLEKEMPFEADLRVDFIRHGMPSYTLEEIETGEIEGELTPDGIKQIENSARKLAQKIDKEKEIIVIWTSPKKRAQQSAEIISNVFREMGISVVEKGSKDDIESNKLVREIGSLRDVDITADAIKELSEKEVSDDWMKYWAESDDLPNGMERPDAVKNRTERLVNYLEKIARTIQAPLGKKLHFVCVGHEETVRDLLEEAYSFGTEKGEGPNYGETLQIDVNKSTREKDAVLNLKYRGKEAKLNFDKDSRRFYQNKTK